MFGSQWQSFHDTGDTLQWEKQSQGETPPYLPCVSFVTFPLGELGKVMVNPTISFFLGTPEDIVCENFLLEISLLKLNCRNENLHLEQPIINTFWCLRQVQPDTRTGCGFQEKDCRSTVPDPQELCSLVRDRKYLHETLEDPDNKVQIGIVIYQCLQKGDASEKWVARVPEGSRDEDGCVCYVCEGLGWALTRVRLRALLGCETQGGHLWSLALGISSATVTTNHLCSCLGRATHQPEYSATGWCVLSNARTNLDT